MNDFDDFLSLVDKGIRGDSVYLPLQQPKLGSKISLPKGQYWILGGMPGSGKTAIADSVLVLELYDWWQANKHQVSVKPHWIYRSMERPRVYKIAKWTCYKIYKDYGINIDVPTLLQWPSKSKVLTSSDRDLIASYRDYFTEMWEYVDIVDGAMNPTGIYKYAVEKIQSRGRIEQISEHKSKFIYNDDNELWIHLSDHIGKITSETIKGTHSMMNDKQILDKHSEYMGILRDRYMMNPIDIIQLNRDIEDTTRGLKTELDIQPKDFKGSSDMYENADVAIGMMNPYKLKDFTHMDYDIKRFVTANGHNRFRSMKVIKNSWGIDDFRIGYQFLGENGVVTELPKSDDFKYGFNGVTYEQYTR